MQNLGLPRYRGKVIIVPEISVSAAVARVSSSANILAFLVITSSRQKCAFPLLHPIKKILAEVLNPRREELLFQSWITENVFYPGVKTCPLKKLKVSIMDFGQFRNCLLNGIEKSQKTHENGVLNNGCVILKV